MDDNGKIIYEWLYNGDIMGYMTDEEYDIWVCMKLGMYPKCIQME
jgi:hypothetical protein